MADFHADLKEIVRDWMQQCGIKFKKNDDLFHLLIKYFTFCEKYISPQKRSVKISAELSSKTNELPVHTQKAINKMQEWIAQGVDVNCFQSRGLYGSGSRDYQNMLYGIVHLHLSAKENDVLPKRKKDGFAKAGEYLLFVFFKNDSAYFLDVAPHPETLSPKNPHVKEWTASQYIKIIENNWPELLQEAKLPITSLYAGEGIDMKQSDADIAFLTVGNVNTPIEGDLGFYMLGLGVTSSGDSVKAVISAQDMVNCATRCQLYFDENEDKIKDFFLCMLSNAKMKIPPVFDFHYVYLPYVGRPFLRDRSSGLQVDFLDYIEHPFCKYR